MKKILIAIACLFMSLVASAAEISGKVGVGAVFGEPTGFTAKLWNDGVRAFDAGLAYSFSEFLIIYADHLWHFPGWVRGTALDRKGHRFMPYVGVGGVFVISTEGGRSDRKLFLDTGNTVGLGLRLPVGLEWLPADPPLGVFLELVPGMGLAPSVEGFFQGGLGIRYYF
ncbi:MAG: hypothetical protein A2X94_11205 [Bdellovibrionales bacterium GWB1_55_8]|nr:MAG: hypothetical protein A2X94_11205 [Bdellovibrionales bacterium GWB1_55_8]